MNQLIGNCKCGQVQYSVAGSVLQVVVCHCNMCRQMTGSAFSSYVVVQDTNLTFTQGQKMLASYSVTEQTTRHFCTTCGTPIFNSNPATYSGLAMLYLGTLDGHETLSPRIDIFCESKLPWVRINEASKCFSRSPRNA